MPFSRSHASGGLASGYRPLPSPRRPRMPRAAIAAARALSAAACFAWSAATASALRGSPPAVIHMPNVPYTREPCLYTYGPSLPLLPSLVGRTDAHTVTRLAPAFRSTAITASLPGVSSRDGRQTSESFTHTRASQPARTASHTRPALAACTRVAAYHVAELL